jgi:hypothetical protein
MLQWMIRSQAPTAPAATGKVQRLDGGGRSGGRLVASRCLAGTTEVALPTAKVKSVPAGNRSGFVSGSLRLNLTQHGETHQVQTQVGLTD